MNRARLMRLSGAVVLVGVVVSSCADPAPPTTVAAVRPVDVILVSNGGADVPSGDFAQLVVGCDQDLRAARDQECLDAARAASGSPDPSVRAAGEALGYVAGTNLPGAVPDPAAEDSLIGHLDRMPYLTRLRVAELFYRAQMARHAAVGDAAGADRALQRALQTVPASRVAAVQAERCRAAVGPAACASTAVATTSAPPTTAPTESPTGTSSASTGSGTTTGAATSTGSQGTGGPPSTGDQQTTGAATASSAPTSSG